MPTFARDQWVSLIQGEALGNPLWSLVCHAFQSTLYQLSVDIAISIQLILVSNSHLVLNSRRERKGVTY